MGKRQKALDRGGQRGNGGRKGECRKNECKQGLVQGRKDGSMKEGKKKFLNILTITSNGGCRREEKSRKHWSLFTKFLFSVTANLFIY